MSRIIAIRDHRRPWPNEARPDFPEGRLNEAIAWVSIACAMLAGAVIGLWSFGGPLPAPAGFEAYDALPRRLFRLAHIAAIALPVLNLLYVRYLGSGKGSRRIRLLGCRLLLAGSLLLPTLLAGAAFWLPLRYALPLPVSCLIAATVLQAQAQLRSLFSSKGERR